MARTTQILNQKRAELEAARAKVYELERGLSSLEGALKADKKRAAERDPPRYPFTQQQYTRYGRQMILPAVGVSGQLKLEQSKLLVIGAGGLGCPVLQYLAGAGVGHITILDHDSVELSNLHRQVLHSEATIGLNKAESARLSLARLNSDIVVEAHAVAFTPALFANDPATTTPPQLLSADFNIILDCTDNPATRHFLNAYAVAHGIPLVSGGAVRAEGTVGVYNLPLATNAAPVAGPSSTVDEHTPQFGPCYACLFPPPPPQASLSDEQRALQGTGACSDEGVLGVLCGQVGLTMASEALKVILGTAKPTMHLLHPLSPTPLRTIKVRPRQPTCAACGPGSESKWADFASGQTGGVWEGWEDPLCAVPGVGEREGSSGVVDPLSSGESRLSAVDLEEATALRGVRLIDTRSSTEFDIANLEGSKNIPLAQLLKDPQAALAIFDEPRTPSDQDSLISSPSDGKRAKVDTSEWPIYFVCRRGNDSLIAARALRRHIAQRDAAGDASTDKDAVLEVGDVKGGLVGWSRDVDPEFPIY